MHLTPGLKPRHPEPEARHPKAQEGETFKVVVCSEVIEHVSDVPAMVAQLCSLVLPASPPPHTADLKGFSGIARHRMIQRSYARNFRRDKGGFLRIR